MNSTAARRTWTITDRAILYPRAVLDRCHLEHALRAYCAGCAAPAVADAVAATTSPDLVGHGKYRAGALPVALTLLSVRGCEGCARTARAEVAAADWSE